MGTYRSEMSKTIYKAMGDPKCHVQEKERNDHQGTVSTRLSLEQNFLKLLPEPRKDLSFFFQIAKHSVNEFCVNPHNQPSFSLEIVLFMA